MHEGETRPIHPQAGDVVTIDRPYLGLALGTRAVIDGGNHYGGGFVMAVVGASAFRGPSSAYASDQTPYVSCSGGPCPCIPESDLVYVGTTEQTFWRWRGLPCAGSGEEYTLTVNLWSWPLVDDESGTV